MDALGDGFGGEGFACAWGAVEEDDEALACEGLVGCDGEGGRGRGTCLCRG